MRRAAAVLLAFGMAASAYAAPAAKRPPPVSSVTPGIAGSVPYVAPWQATFDRYGVQVIAGAVQAVNIRRITVPQSQYWRVIYMYATITTSAVVANRVMNYQIVPGDGSQGPFQPANIAIPANTTANYLFGPNLSPYSNVAVAADEASVQPIPDLIWPPGTIIQAFLTNADGGDLWSASFAVEIYSIRPHNEESVAVPSAATPVLL